MPFFLKEKRTAIIFISLILLHLVLISIQVPLGRDQTLFERAIFAVLAPFQHGVASLIEKVRNTWNNYFYLREVQKQNQQMREEIFYLRQEKTLLANALRKYKGEEEIRQRLAQFHPAFEVASVIGVDASNIHKSIVVNKGTADGIQRDMVVLDRYGNLAGRVVGPVSFKEARVQLITDDESGVGVISEEKRAMGVLRGDGSGKCFLRYVLASQEISEGEELVTSGFDNLYPSGIKVGNVLAVNPGGSPFRNIIVSPYLNMSELDQVAILTASPKELY